MADPHAYHAPKRAYSREDLLRSGRGGYFGPGNAQLPAPPMLMMDRIRTSALMEATLGRGGSSPSWTSILRSGSRLPLHWRSGHAGLPGIGRHVAGDRVLLGWSGSPGKGRALGVGEVRFRGYVTPDTKLVRYDVSIKQARRGKLALAVADTRMFADDACAYTAADLKVGMIASG